VEDEQYYALCVEDEQGEPEIAFFELSNEALPGALGISLYTAPMESCSAGICKTARFSSLPRATKISSRR
jgi:hypothetical protein